MNLKPWQRRLFYLILFLIPSNLAKHFILPSSYVSGILVDYLIPTVYLTDVLIIILIGSELQRWRLRQRSKLVPNLLIIFLILLLPSIIFSQSPLPAIYKWLKLLELSLFSLWIKQNINLKTSLTQITNVLSASVLFQSILALAQWFKQSSIFGYWFLGEQPFTSATPGIDKIVWFTHAIKIPPMGTFPHPNVLAGFLAVVLPLILYQILNNNKGSSVGSVTQNVQVQHLRSQKGPFLKHSFKAGPYGIVRRFLLYVSLLLGLITLFLTFSLSAWLAFLLIGLPATLLKTIKIRPLKFILVYSGLFLILFSFASNFTFLAPTSSFTRRSQLTQIALKMIKDHPFTGVGLNNFTVNMESYGHVTATTRFLQPVHNIYLLILSETGLLGLLALLYLLYKTSPYKGSEPLYSLSLLSLLFIGLFDHYPLTIHQTTLLLFLLI